MKPTKKIFNFNHRNRNYNYSYCITILLLCISGPAFAVWPVIDTAAIAKFVEQIKNQAIQIENQVKQLIIMKEEIDKLQIQINLAQRTLKELVDDGFNWNNATTKINKLETLLDQTHGLAYNASNINDQFGQIFPGYKEHTTGYAEQYKKSVDTTHTTLKNVLQVIGGSAKNFSDESNRLMELQRQAQGVQGHLQALQVSMRIAAEQIAQLQMLRQTLIAQTNAQVTYYAAEIQKEATREHSLAEAVKKGATVAPTIGHSGYEIKIPKF